MANVNEEAVKLHAEHHGKVAVVSKVPLKTAEDMTLAYTPGVAEPCRLINKDVEKLQKILKNSHRFCLKYTTMFIAICGIEIHKEVF